ncbi:MAG: hypothetical protein L6Q99_14770 [Planctomycetes bacterium]|nr:hypothetical protein [Planctomycetota bacterium]
MYPASFAAAPHVIAELERRAEVAGVSFFHFPAWVEVCRAKKSVAIPVDLEKAYFESCGRLPTLAARAAPKPLERVGLAWVLNAIAAAQG